MKQSDIQETIKEGILCRYPKNLKILAFFIIWLTVVVFLTRSQEKTINNFQLVVPSSGIKDYRLLHTTGKKLKVILAGAFHPKWNDSMSIVFYLKMKIKIGDISSIGEWLIPTVSPNEYDNADIIHKVKVFDLTNDDLYLLRQKNQSVWIQMSTNSNVSFSLKIGYDLSPVDEQTGIVYAIFFLVLLYGLIICEVVHRTFAAIVSSVVSIAVLAALGDRPRMPEIVEWMNIETLILLFCMMILIAVLTETGVFEYLAVLIFKFTGGQVWSMLYCLLGSTYILSTLFGSVTAILFMTPISIRITEIMELNPNPILMASVLSSNVGATLAPISAIPELIIANNILVKSHGITFFAFITHVIVGVMLTFLQTIIQLRITFRNVESLHLPEPKKVKELQREITVWKRAAGSLSSYSKDVDIVRETILKKVKVLNQKLKSKNQDKGYLRISYQQTLDELTSTYPIKNKGLLIKSACVLLFVALLIIGPPLLGIQTLNLGWIALSGTFLLLIVTNRTNMDYLLARIEWTTLLFFAGIFVGMSSLIRLGFYDWIGAKTEIAVASVSEKLRLVMAISIILWVSALASAFISNVPVTAMMLKVIVTLTKNPTLRLPFSPLVWALALGTCLGANGTLYGAAANVICAGMAEQHGYRLSFLEFFRLGFPVMLGNVLLAHAYLMITEVVYQWY